MLQSIVKKRMSILDKNIKKIFVFLLLLSILTKTLSVVFPLITQFTIDAGVDGNIQIIFRCVVALIVVAVFNACTDMVDQVFTQKYKNEIEHMYRKRLAGHIAGLNQKQFEQKEIAEYISLFNNNIPMIVDNYYVTIINILKCAFVVLFSISALFTLNVVLTMIITITSVLTVCVPFLFKKMFDGQNKKISDSLITLNSRLNDFLKGNQIGKIFLAFGKLTQRLTDSSENVVFQKVKYWKLMQRSNAVSTFLTYSRDILIIVIGIMLMMQDQMTVGGLFAAIQLSNLLCAPAVNISFLISNVLSTKGIKLELDTMIQDANCEANLKNDDSEMFYNKMEPKDIYLKNVSFSYRNKQVIKQVDFCFHGGEKYLLVGPSGSGKSTVLKLLSRLYDDYTGKIIVNGKNILDIEDWYKQITICFQDNTIFQDTLRNNMTLWGLYDDSAIEALIDRLQLQDIIRTKGFDSECLNSEKSFSGGEQQRIALVRTFLKPAWLILLDEVTSALDHKNYLRVENLILSVPNSTVVNVSHKIDSEIACRYDKIIFFDNGEIKAAGKYEELLKHNADFRRFITT